MTNKNTDRRVFGAAEYTEEHVVPDWRTLGREELIQRAIISLDGAKMEAEEVGDKHYVRHVDMVLFPFLKAELKKAAGEADSWMTKEERAHYDARAEIEAWELAEDILEPWVKACGPIGSHELTTVMKKALREVRDNINLAHDNLELAEAALKREATSDV